MEKLEKQKLVGKYLRILCRGPRCPFSQNSSLGWWLTGGSPWSLIFLQRGKKKKEIISAHSTAERQPTEVQTPARFYQVRPTSSQPHVRFQTWGRRTPYGEDARALSDSAYFVNYFHSLPTIQLRDFFGPGVAPMYLRIHSRFRCHKFTRVPSNPCKLSTRSALQHLTHHVYCLCLLPRARASSCQLQFMSPKSNICRDSKEYQCPPSSRLPGMMSGLSCTLPSAASSRQSPPRRFFPPHAAAAPHLTPSSPLSSLYYVLWQQNRTHCGWFVFKHGYEIMLRFIYIPLLIRRNNSYQLCLATLNRAQAAAEHRSSISPKRSHLGSGPNTAIISDQS